MNHEHYNPAEISGSGSGVEHGRERIINQKIGAAKTLAHLESVISDNANIDASALEKIAAEESSQYHLTPEQDAVFSAGIKKYEERRSAVAATVGRYRHDHGDNWLPELFNYCFGRYPQGNVEMREGPMTLYWQCYELSDYSVAGNQTPAEASHSFGFRKSLLDEQPDELRGTIILEYSGHPEHMKSGAADREKKSRLTETHERQHIIFDLLRDELDYTPLEFPDLDEHSSLADVQTATERHLQFRRQELERMAKNEIIAYWRDGERSLDEIKRVIMEVGGIYDHRSDTNEEIVSQYLISRFGEKYRNMIPSLRIHEIWERECTVYENHINEAIEVLRDIENTSPDKKLDYVYLLSLERTDKWRRTYELCKERM